MILLGPNSKTDHPRSVIMIIITWALKRYNYELQTSEMFTTAGRSLKSGLVSTLGYSSTHVTKLISNRLLLPSSPRGHGLPLCCRARR